MKLWTNWGINFFIVIIFFDGRRLTVKYPDFTPTKIRATSIVPQYSWTIAIYNLYIQHSTKCNIFSYADDCELCKKNQIMTINVQPLNASKCNSMSYILRINAVNYDYTIQGISPCRMYQDKNDSQHVWLKTNLKTRKKINAIIDHRLFDDECRGEVLLQEHESPMRFISFFWT